MRELARRHLRLKKPSYEASLTKKRIDDPDHLFVRGGVVFEKLPSM
jgi:hypothetical protein